MAAASRAATRMAPRIKNGMISSRILFCAVKSWAVDRSKSIRQTLTARSVDLYACDYACALKTATSLRCATHRVDRGK